METGAAWSSHQTFTSQPAPAASDAPGATAGLSAVIYEDEVPDFVENCLIQLHQNIYSTVGTVNIFRPGLRLSTYVAFDGTRPVQIFLFNRAGHKVVVYNEGIEVNEHDLELFCRSIFQRYGMVSLVAFANLQIRLRELSLPYKAHTTLEDIAVELPRSAEEYRKRLGPASRRQLRRRLDQLQRMYPSYKFEVYTGSTVPDVDLADLIRFQRARMASKQTKSLIDRAQEAQLRQFVRYHGLVGIIRIDGRLAAGAIVHEVGSHYFCHVIAHDPRYNHISLGRLCTFFTISECISRGGKAFHLLWGEYEYKYQSLGVRHDLQSIVVYRSILGMLLHPQPWLKNWLKSARRQAPPWLKHARDYARRKLQRPSDSDEPD